METTISVPVRNMRLNEAKAAAATASPRLCGEQAMREICDFLSDYSVWLWGCGATCIRLEKNVKRMAEAFGVSADMSIMPSHVHTTVWNSDKTSSVCIVRRIHKSAISFNINTQLSKLSWDVAEGRCRLSQAKAEFELIKRTAPANPRHVLVLASLANASFCRLFGGDLVSMLIVFVSTLCGYRIKQIMIDDKADVRLVFLCSSFISAVMSACGHLFGLGTTPEIALGSSVLYLIPGIPYINSVSDMLDGHYLCAFSRLMDALVLTVCLSTGLSAGLLLMNISMF